MLSSMILLFALAADHIIGEVKIFHPLVGFGFLTNKLEAYCNIGNNISGHDNKSPTLPRKIFTKLLGMFCWMILVLPLPLVYLFLHQAHWLFYCLDIVIVYFSIAYNSLVKHAEQILTPLKNDDINTGRHFCAYIVSRNTNELSEQEIARATTESVLENGHDAVIASLFWFVVGGAPLVLIHRLANTLDAMWGYKNSRFINFGWFAARVDDLLGWPSAKITSLLYAIQGRFFTAIKNGFIQGRQYKSLNGGWVMATGATVLNIKLGGLANYHGKQHQSVTLGCGETVSTNAIKPSLRLVRDSAIIFIGCYLAVEFIPLLLSL